MRVPRSSSAFQKQPTLFKLAASFVYDTLVVIAIGFLTAWLFIMLFGNATQGVKRYALQASLWLVIGIYFVWCWSKSGQTLAMHTWRLKLVNQQALPPGFSILVLRYMLATFSLLLIGLGFIWAIFDPERCYLHDRILKTRIIQLAK
jgi:uncharacterized RDD family membrane protein YckC